MRTRVPIYCESPDPDSDSSAPPTEARGALDAVPEGALGALKDVARGSLGFKIFDWLDARGLGAAERLSSGLERLARQAAAERARKTYPDAAAAAVFGLVPEELGARYLAGRELPWTAPLPETPRAWPPAPTQPLPPAVAQLWPAAFSSPRDEGAQLLLTPEAEDDTIFFVTVSRRRLGEEASTPLVEQAVPASLLGKVGARYRQPWGNRQPVRIARPPGFRALRSATVHGFLEGETETVDDPYEEYEDAPEGTWEAYQVFLMKQWEAHRSSVSALIGGDDFHVSVRAASVKDGDFICVLEDSKLELEPEHTNAFSDDTDLKPLFGVGRVGLVNQAHPAKNLLQGTDGILFVRVAIGLTVLAEETIGGGDFVRATITFDELSLSLTPYKRGDNPQTVFGWGETRKPAESFPKSHRHSQGIAVLRAVDSWWPSKPSSP